MSQFGIIIISVLGLILITMASKYMEIIGGGGLITELDEKINRVKVYYR